eukprot:jgi/Botrbrau1/574/Bobra.0010s0040.1
MARVVGQTTCLAFIFILIRTCSSERQQVHIVFSNHLDIGFDGLGTELGTVDNVLDRYVQSYFPKAIEIAQELRDRGGPEQLKYMTHSWLVSMYLDCPPNMGWRCPNSTEVVAFREAVQREDIWWHAFPHNAQMEVMDESLLTFGVTMTHELDALFGLAPKITLSQRDVPGMSRSAIRPLTAAGVEAISVGVNPASAPPAVPANQPFWWRDPASGSKILAMWHPGGYSGFPVDDYTECVKAKGFKHVLCAAWKGDNAGPHDVREVDNIFNITRTNFPNADVFASTFDNYTQQLVEAAPGLDLPTVTDELADTWVWGVSSDPDKVAQYREMLRYRSSIEHLSDTAAYRNFSRMLLKIPEHTWGLDTREALPDFTNWGNAAFHRQLEDKKAIYLRTVASWKEQKSFVDYAISALEPLQEKAARAVIDGMQRSWAAPDPASAPQQWRGAPASEAQTAFQSQYWNIQLDPLTGALEGLSFNWGSKRGGQWASADNNMARFMYSSYIEDDFTDFLNTYLFMEVTQDNSWWVLPDLAKPGISKSSPRPRRLDLFANSSEIFVKKDNGSSFHVLVKSEVLPWAVKHVGAPQAVWLDIRSKENDRDLYIDVILANKTATRLPEALWVTFTPDPHVADPATWQMYKINQRVSPNDVILNGSQALHAVTDEGLVVRGHAPFDWEQLQIMSLDAALVSPGYPEVFPVLQEKPDLEQGVTFNLMNNIWGTNYVMWSPYEPVMESMRFRFILRMHDLSQGPPEDEAYRPRYAPLRSFAPVVQAEAPAPAATQRGAQGKRLAPSRSETRDQLTRAEEMRRAQVEGDNDEEPGDSVLSDFRDEKDGSTVYGLRRTPRDSDDVNPFAG